VIRPTEIDRLDVLEGGQSTSAPSELLSSPAFVAVLEQLKGQYDRILIDSPPVGIVTDAQILATRCDATLLVLRAEESSRILTQRARDALLAVGARVAGAVVNDLSKRAGRYGYHSGCSYVYSHPHGGAIGDKATSHQKPLAEARPGPANGASSPENLKG
jgi:capsular exopolysaccharide synthesis family protein